MRIDTIPEVKNQFWKEYQDAVGMYTVGEDFNYGIDHVAQYQQSLDGLLNYPMYGVMKEIYLGGGSMYRIRETRDAEQRAFKDVSALGLFVDNHDNPRFLHFGASYTQYKGALTYVLFGEGIPIIYYGSEQGYAGGDDPYCRETLWQNFNQDAELYQWIKKAVNTRKTAKVWEHAHVERWIDDDLYAFTRGDLLVAMTRGGYQERDIDYHEFNEGDVLCDQIDEGDCVTVTGGKIHVKLVDGRSKAYLKQTQAEASFLLE